jgi:hypothetical protein
MGLEMGVSSSLKAGPVREKVLPRYAAHYEANLNGFPSEGINSQLDQSQGLTSKMRTLSNTQKTTAIEEASVFWSPPNQD